MACGKDWLHNFCHDNPSRLIFHARVTVKYAPRLDCGTKAIHTLVVKASGRRGVNYEIQLISIFLASAMIAGGARGGRASAMDLPAQQFPPEEVRLLDGPFRHAMERDAKYLLSLEPDRLLSGFRSEAGLKPKADKYGGWESQGIAGHTLGHYLSACSRMYQDTGNSEFLDRVNYVVDQLAECQKANGNGYVAAIPDGKKIFAEVARGEIRTHDFDLNGAWVPWYTIHKEFAGLIDAYRFCDSTQALAVATNLADWVDATTKNLTEAQWQKMLVCEQGGMNEAMADLYALTGNTNYLNLAEKFYHQAVMDPLARGDDILDGLHSNMQIPKTIGAARLYELTGEPRYADIARFFWDRVALHRSYVIGGNGDSEHFFPINAFARHLDAATCETCCTYNMLKLTLHLFEWSPSAAEMDFYERALYNDILASQDPDTGHVRLPDVPAIRRFQDLLDAGKFVLVLRRHPAWKTIRGTARRFICTGTTRSTSICSSLRNCPGRNKGLVGPAGHEISRPGHDAPDIPMPATRQTGAENPLAGLGGVSARHLDQWQGANRSAASPLPTSPWIVNGMTAMLSTFTCR